MTPEHNDALHRVQRAHPHVRWIEEDGDIILYREESKRFIHLVVGGVLFESEALAALAALEAEIGVPSSINVTFGDYPDEEVTEPVAPPANDAGEPMMPVSMAMDLIEEALAKKDGE